MDVGATGQTTKTIELVAYISGDGKLIDLDGGTHTIEVSGGNLVAGGFASPTYYVDGVAAATVATGWHHLMVTTDTGISVSDLDIGRVGASYGLALQRDLVLYSDAKELSFAKTAYATLARRVMYEWDSASTPPSIAPISSGLIPGTDYTVESGSHEVKEDAAGKWIEVETGGRYWRSNTFAYGTWEFEFEKVSGETRVEFMPISSSNAVRTDPSVDGYLLRMDDSEKIFFYRITGGAPTSLFYTAASYFDVGTKYKIRITRTLEGVFTVWIKGGSFDGWTLVVSKDGPNPITSPAHSSSAYTTHDNDPGDRIHADSQYLGVIS
ncbi:MAG: hypothetical protein KAS32_16575 [Candidatus Peribacteraceae bacterium]|nr:hypothetical protein [Candidatus Peribacteraceae bacterium]